MPRVLVVAALWTIVATAPVAQALAEGESPTEFARQLASVHVPMGMVVPVTEVVGRQRDLGALTEGSPKSLSAVELRSSIQRFNALKGRFRASQRGDVVHVRSVEEPAEVTTLLDRSTKLDGGVEVPAMLAIYQHVVSAMTGKEQPEGYAWSGALPSPACPINQKVHLPSGLTAEGVLDQVVSQVPGLIWVLTYNPQLKDNTMAVGLMCADGTFFRTAFQP